MADHAEFSATELDHLEDALEGLELAPPADSAPQIRRRLEEYRNILSLSRAAMPMVDVPRGLLDSVLAEARASVEAPAITPSVAEPPRESFWSKVRRFGLLPGVALAGTAAAVLFMVERKDETTAQVVASASKSDAKVSAEVRTPVAEPTSAAAPGAAAANYDRTGANAVAADPAPPPALAPSATPVSPAPEPESAKRKLEDAGAVVEESPNDGADVQLGEANDDAKKNDKKMPDAETPRWDIIARGDRARHRGECKVARNEYALALDDVDARVRARAHAGLGLCDAADGDRKSADAAYTAARELDGEIVAFIDDERPRAAGTSPAKAKPKAAASKKSKVDVLEQQNAMDPL